MTTALPRRRTPAIPVSVATALLALALALAASVAGAAPASAHAVLESSTPAQGSRLAAAPTAVTLVFSEEVGVADRALQVFDVRGRRVDRSDAAHADGDPRTLRVSVEGLEQASYTVCWRVVSVDGHPASGSFAFGVGVPAGSVPPVLVVDPAVASVRAVAQLVAYAGTAMVIGGSVFLFVLWRGGQRSARLRRVLGAGCAVAGTGAVVTLLVQGPYVAGGGLADVLDVGLLGETLGSSYGRPLLLRVLAVALSVPVLGIWPRVRDDEDAGPGGVAAAGNLLLFAASFALTGHAAEASPRLLAEAADAVHLMAAGAWLGGLVVLLAVFLPEADARERADVLPHWSRLAASCVGLLVLTGAYQAWREVRLLGALTGTAYGRLLLAKLSGVLVLLAVAVLARRAVAGSGSGSASRARALVTAEAVLGLAVLGVTSFLVATPPSRVTFGPPYSAGLTARDVEGRFLRVDLDIASTHTGSQTLRLRVVAPDGAPAVFDSATAQLHGPGDAPPLEATFAGGPDSGGPESGAGTATVDVPVAGRWSLTVHVVIGSVSDYAATTTYTVR